MKHSVDSSALADEYVQVSLSPGDLVYTERFALPAKKYCRSRIDTSPICVSHLRPFSRSNSHFRFS